MPHIAVHLLYIIVHYRILSYIAVYYVNPVIGPYLLSRWKQVDVQEVSRGCPVTEEVKQYAGRGNVILMEDGAPFYIAKATKALYDRNDVWKMKWPTNSPNSNPIENVWRLLKYRVGKRFPKTDEEVRQYIEEEWERL